MPTYTATGSTTTAFGDHLGVMPRTGVATGIPPNYSGVPRGPDNNEYHGAGGFKSTTIPAPRSLRHVTASGWVSAGGVGVPAGYVRLTTRFGTPVSVPVAAGRLHTAFGLAGALRGMPPPEWVLDAGSWQAGAWGTPTARPGGKSYAATSIASTLFGSMKSVQRGRATGALVGGVGAPASLRQGRATGLFSTTFGSPKAGRRAAATGYTVTSFGLAEATRARTYLAYGFTSTRVSIATATTRAPGFAAAGAMTTAFGAPAAKNTGRAIPFGPCAAFGAPNLKQSLTC